MNTTAQLTAAQEEQLIANAAGGDLQAFNELVLRYQERVYWVVRRFVSTHAHADEITQETFIKAYHSLRDFRAESSVFTWLYRIAVNVAIDFRRDDLPRMLELLDLLTGTIRPAVA